VEEDANVLLLQTRTQVQKSERTTEQDEWDATDQAKFADPKYEGKRPTDYYIYQAEKATAGYDGYKPYGYSYTDMFGTPSAGTGATAAATGYGAATTGAGYKPYVYTDMYGGKGVATAGEKPQGPYIPIKEPKGKYDPCMYYPIEVQATGELMASNGMLCWYQPGTMPPTTIGYDPKATTGYDPKDMPVTTGYDPKGPFKPITEPPGKYDPCNYYAVEYIEASRELRASNGMLCWYQPTPPPDFGYHGPMGGYHGPMGSYDPCMYTPMIHTRGQLIYADNGLPCWQQPGMSTYDYGHDHGHDVHLDGFVSGDFHVEEQHNDHKYHH